MIELCKSGDAPCFQDLMLGLWHPSTAAAGSPETPLAFTYYVPIPVPQAVNAAADGCADLSKQDTQPTQPLLTGLARNFSAAGRDHPFVLDQIDPDPVFPLCSSSTTAMAVGFFAYKSEHLLLLEMSAPQLLQKKPRASILLEASGSCQLRWPWRRSIRVTCFCARRPSP